jgi:hypothetical protein
MSNIYVVYHSFNQPETDSSAIEKWLYENTNLLANEIGFYIVESDLSEFDLCRAVRQFVEDMDLLIVIPCLNRLAYGCWSSDSLRRLSIKFNLESTAE